MFFPPVQMVNAIKNSLTIKNDRERNIEGTPEAAVNANKAHNATSMSSLNSFTSGESKWTNVRRTAITTASFKTRKLPDDIPIVPGNAPNTPGIAAAATASAGPPPLATKSTSSIGTIGTNQNANSTPPTPPANFHGSHHMLQNNKNLDSIDEESTERLLANGDSASGKGSNVPLSAKKAAKKNPVMNLFKELKDSKPKLPKGSSTKENGKVQHSLLSNSNSNSKDHHSHSRDRDSDTSGLSDGTAKMSLDSEDADVMIPMRRLNSTKYIDDEVADDGDEAERDKDEVDCPETLIDVDYNGDGQQVQHSRDDDEGSSDRSAASSKGLLPSSSKKSSNEGKQQQPAGVKLSV